MMNSYSMTQLAASIAKAMDAEAPKYAEAPIPAVQQLVDKKLGGKADRVLIYNPDCLGIWFWQKYTDKYLPVQLHTQLALPVASVMQSVTPVNFATMYTGAAPAVHGIRVYEKPIVRTDSLFDSVRRSGKKVALVAIANSSMGLIFQERDIDYYIVEDDAAATDKGLELIEKDEYDLIVVYNMDYDEMIHAHTPEAPEAIAAAERNIRDFDRLATAVEKNWKQHNSLVVWASDHGNHLDWDGHGNHGEFREEDINVIHFYGAFPKA